MHRHIVDLNATQMNVQCSLIGELKIYKFELCHNSVEAMKNIYWVKGEDTVDHSTVTWWFKKFHSGCMNIDESGKVR